MLKIAATWKKNMFRFNTAEWVGSRQPPPHHEPLTPLWGQAGVCRSPAGRGGSLDPQTRLWGLRGVSGGTGWPQGRAARGLFYCKKRTPESLTRLFAKSFGVRKFTEVILPLTNV